MSDLAALDLVGPRDVAERLGIPRNTVLAWKLRGQLPEPELIISRIPIWRWETIHAWYEDRKSTDD